MSSQPPEPRRRLADNSFSEAQLAHVGTLESRPNLRITASASCGPLDQDSSRLGDGRRRAHILAAVHARPCHGRGRVADYECREQEQSVRSRPDGGGMRISRPFFARECAVPVHVELLQVIPSDQRAIPVQVKSRRLPKSEVHGLADSLIPCVSRCTPVRNSLEVIVDEANGSLMRSPRRRQSRSGRKRVWACRGVNIG